MILNKIFFKFMHRIRKGIHFFVGVSFLCSFLMSMHLYGKVPFMQFITNTYPFKKTYGNVALFINNMKNINENPSSFLLSHYNASVKQKSDERGLEIEKDGIKITQLLVANQEGGEGPCALYAMGNASAILSHLKTKEPGSLSHKLLSKQGVKSTIGSLGRAGYNSIRAHFPDQGEWLDGLQLHTAVTQVFVPHAEFEDTQDVWPKDVPFGIFNTEILALIDPTVLHNDSLKEHFKDIKSGLETLEDIREKIKNKQNFTACFLINTATAENKGHWFTTIVHSDCPGQIQFIVADSLNKIRIFGDKSLEDLVQYITNKRDILYIPESIKDYVNKGFLNIIEYVQNVSGYSEKLSKLLTNAHDFAEAHNLLSGLEDSYIKAMNKLTTFLS